VARHSWRAQLPNGLQRTLLGQPWTCLMVPWRAIATWWEVTDGERADILILQPDFVTCGERRWTRDGHRLMIMVCEDS
jgi:hypothetical protein